MRADSSNSHLTFSVSFAISSALNNTSSSVFPSVPLLVHLKKKINSLFLSSILYFRVSFAQHD